MKSETQFQAASNLLANHHFLQLLHQPLQLQLKMELLLQPLHQQPQLQPQLQLKVVCLQNLPEEMQLRLVLLQQCQLLFNKHSHKKKVMDALQCQLHHRRLLTLLPQLVVMSLPLSWVLTLNHLLFPQCSLTENRFQCQMLLFNKTIMIF